MPAISRQVGATSEYLMVFIPDATVSTGVGLANINVTNITMAWYRSDMAAASTLTLSTGTLGTWANSTANQVLSNGALGWYAISVPNGVFASGRSAMVHLAGAASMAPVPILIELTKTDNQTYMSSTTISTALNSLAADMRQILGTTPVTSVAGILSVNVSTVHLATALTTAPGIFSVNVTTIHTTAAVTQSAGILATVWDLGRTANLTSTIALTATTISTNQLVNVNQILGSTPVTSAAGVQKADIASIYGTAPVTSAAGIQAVTWDLGRTANLTSTVALTAFSVAYATTVGSVAGAVGSVTGLNGALLDVSVSSRLPTASYTTPPTVAQISSAVLTTAMGESYRAAGAAGTLAQVAYELLAHHGESSISGTTKTINKVDHATAAATYTLDSSTSPAAITRAT